ncbi:type II toxin-antitoxin system HigB family toxin [Pontibacter anaerobius]|uniref:Type II toxin-antitoxin system HigB family toxin n=1 Tax=Pontibacter anaerobius TaxID=2993940 RepID=A0ABT3RD68_9BACT|nr:type II toxin-antitoxin system HigB family toxin [Pontibacter anaerobius]MCX2739497.1 type II toxin-antitoxin system HigB family toxin [Pontibacter anaerobius]
MHVISQKTIKEYYEKHAAAKPYLTAWYKTVKKAQWGSVNDIRQDFPSAEMVVDGKVVFNIKANDFRLVALVGFRGKKVFVLWIGTHAEYDKIKIKDL